MLKKLPKVALLIESSRKFGRGVLSGIAKYVHVHGPWSCYIEERELHGGIPDWLKQVPISGIIARIDSQRTGNELLRLGRPVIDVRASVRFERIPAFATDTRAVAQMAADFFLQAGFRHFAFCGYPGIPFSDDRGVAFADYLATHGYATHHFSPPPRPLTAGRRGANPPLTLLQAVEQRGLENEKAVAAWLLKQPRPLALLACNDICGQQVLNACREHGVNVPGEVAVMGVDDDEVLCTISEPPLSSIKPDAERVGTEAAALLDAMMKGKRAKPRLVEIPPLWIVERASTDIVAIEDPVMVQALRFIRSHVNEGINVKDVLAHVGCSRTDLGVRFRHWLKTSIRTEIVRIRLDRACSLLRQTNLGLAEIARQSGFRDAPSFCRLFQNRLRQTPTQYRHAKKSSI
ncbi:Transcriptional regulator [Verrucomicrobia bacterium]|nr:Transcriptional regulator [Verrucomicrobiota bacterium]